MALDSLGPKRSVTPQFSNAKTDPLRTFKFVVDITHTTLKPDGVTAADIGSRLGFMSVSGFSASTAAIPYRAGGMNTTPAMLPGQTSFNPISFTRGQLFGSYLDYQWFQELFAVNVGTGNYVENHGNQFRATVDVYVLPHPRTDAGDGGFEPVGHFRIYNAWPTSIAYGDLNAGDNAFLVTSMVLAHEGWEFRAW